MVAPMDLPLIADFLKRRLTHLGWTQADLSRMSGISDATIRKVQNGQSATRGTYYRLTLALGIPEADTLERLADLSTSEVEALVRAPAPVPETPLIPKPSNSKLRARIGRTEPEDVSTQHVFPSAASGTPSHLTPILENLAKAVSELTAEVRELRRERDGQPVERVEGDG